MVVYELQCNKFEAEETANLLAGDWTVFNKGATKVLVENHEVNQFMREIAESIEDE